MKTLLLQAVIAVFVIGAAETVSRAAGTPDSPVLEHGGGCRKSSPPGKCCHLDKKAGVVHCH